MYEKNKQAVREQIVNPILSNLGWNPENLKEVQQNIYTKEGKPDYPLKKNEKIFLFVEAKTLNVDVTKIDNFKQLAKYCFSEGTKCGILTNGAVWMLIKSFE